MNKTFNYIAVNKHLIEPHNQYSHTIINTLYKCNLCLNAKKTKGSTSTTRNFSNSSLINSFCRHHTLEILVGKKFSRKRVDTVLFSYFLSQKNVQQNTQNMNKLVGILPGRMNSCLLPSSFSKISLFWRHY